MARKVIQITAASCDQFSELFALCDDGTVWERVKNMWQPLYDIPQGTLDKVRKHYESQTKEM